MRMITICGCLLAAGSLLLLASCAGEPQRVQKKGPEREASVVTLDTCRADPDTVRVHKGSNVSWSVPQTDSYTYTIQFNSTPIPEKTVRVGANAPDKPHPVKGDFWCSTLGDRLGACFYAYTLTKEDGSVCPDPGVHVIP